MRKNVGGPDRAIRFVIGTVLATIGVTVLAGIVPLLSGTSTVVMALLSLFLAGLLLASVATRSSWLNAVIGIDTYRTARMHRSNKTSDDRSQQPRFRGDD